MDKEQRVNIRISEEDKADLREVSKIIDLPTSYIVRDAIRDKIAELKRTHPRLKAAQTQVTTNA